MWYLPTNTIHRMAEEVGETEMQAVPLHKIEETSEVASHESSDSIVMHFEDSADESKFACMLQYLQRCMLTYLFTSAATFCSSNYTTHASNLDVLIVSTDIITIDVCSCFFVLSGFTATYVYSSIGWDAWKGVHAVVTAQIFADVWVSTVAVLLFGSLDTLMKTRFHLKDIGLTLFEGITALRVLDNKQNIDAPHTLNVSLWPVQIFAWALLSVHGTYSMNEYLHRKFGQIANYGIITIAVCGISLFTLFGMLHSHTNVFYANATNIMYRSLEFNLGIHFFYLSGKQYALLDAVIRITAQCASVVYCVFIATWWSEIGVNVNTEQQLEADAEVCLRLYPRNHCLHDHHAFLLRGCLLGLTLISSLSTPSSTPLSLQGMIRRTKICASAVALSWPTMLLVQLVFVITFSADLVYRNIALVALMMCCFTLLGAYVYTVSIQPLLAHYILQHATAVAHTFARWYASVCGSVLVANDMA